MNEIRVILDKVAAELSTVQGIQSVVLGGSRARGTHSPSSDIDSKNACTQLRHLINEVKELLTAEQTEHVTVTLDKLSNSKSK